MITEAYLRSSCTVQKDHLLRELPWLAICHAKVLSDSAIWIPARGRTKREALDACVEATIAYAISGVLVLPELNAMHRATAINNHDHRAVCKIIDGVPYKDQR